MKKILFLAHLVVFSVWLKPASLAQSPVISSFTPVSGPVGTLVTITGSNLSSPTAFSIGGVSAIMVSNTGSTLVGLVIPGAITGAVSVTTAGGTATSSGNFTITPTPFPSTQQGSKLVGTGAAAGNVHQGYSVSLSSDGNTAIVGGYTDNSYAGAVWVYTRTGGVWTQQGGKLVGTGAVGNARQGVSVSLSSDGNTAIVGGYIDNNSYGAAWVYIRTGGVWSQQGGKLVGTGGSGNAYQGSSVSLSSDGNTAIVGGYGDMSGIGAAWVYTRTGGVWSQQGGKLVGTGAVGNAGQGVSVSLSSDGNTAIVGGYRDNGFAGAAWVYTRTGGVWSQQGGKLVGTGAVGNAEQGSSVSIASDGNTAIVGGLSDNSGAGAVWVYIRTGGMWAQQGGKLVGTGALGPNARQGTSVSLSADGNTAIVSGYFDNTFYGAAWVYTRMGSVWAQQGGKLVGTGYVGHPYQGISVSLSSDGKTAIMGGPGDGDNDDDLGPPVGAVWIFSCTSPDQPSSITGNATICSGSLNTYSIAPVAGATDYTWTLPSGWTGISTTNSINATSSASSGNISIKANNGCGSSLAQTLVITVNSIPAQPGTITGNATICAGSLNSYSITPVAGSTSYTWTLPSGWTGTSTTNSINATASASSGNILVKANNGCGSSVAQTLAIAVNTIPAQPGTITGNTTICVGSLNSFSITPVAGSSSYTWTLPSGWTGTSTTNSINATASTSGGNISVTANNTCGTSTPQVTTTITVNPIPTITFSPASPSICFGSSTNITASGASTYSWSPAIGLSTTTGTTVTANPSTTTTYMVTGTTASGCTNIAAVEVSVNPIPIAAGGNHSVILNCGTCGGSINANGLNSSGQLGNGTLTQRTSPFPVSGLTGTSKAVASGSSHSLFLKSDGTVWATGLNTSGQLGDGTTANRQSPVQVSGLTNVVEISAGNTHSLFLKNDGTVWACGLNTNGQLGDGSLTQRTTPVQVAGLSGITKISGGGTHSLFLKNDGTVWACGRNTNGQLGDGTTTRRTIPVIISSLTGMTQISAGGNHSHFLKNNGTAWAVGLNTNGQLGDGTTVQRTSPVLISSLTNLTAVSAGAIYTLFLKNDGTAWATGLNSNGQLGDGTLTQRITPVQVSSLTGITALDAGGTHSLFLKNDGFIWACGRNANGQLGDGTTTRRMTPVQIINLNPCGRMRSIDAQEMLITAELLPIDIYPNPANKEVTIDFSEGVKQPTLITLFDGFGRVLMQNIINQGEATKTLSVTELPSGVYFIRLKIEDQTYIKKILIVH